MCVHVYLCRRVCAYVSKKVRTGRWGDIGVGNSVPETVLHVGRGSICFSVCESGVGELPLTLALKLQPKQPFSCSLSLLTYKRGNNNSAFPCRTCLDSQIIARESENSNGSRAHSKKGNDLQVKLSWVQHKRKPGTGANWEVHAPCKEFYI